MPQRDYGKLFQSTFWLEVIWTISFNFSLFPDFFFFSFVFIKIFSLCWENFFSPHLLGGDLLAWNFLGKFIGNRTWPKVAWVSDRAWKTGTKVDIGCYASNVWLCSFSFLMSHSPKFGTSRIWALIIFLTFLLTFTWFFLLSCFRSEYFPLWLQKNLFVCPLISCSVYLFFITIGHHCYCVCGLKIHIFIIGEGLVEEDDSISFESVCCFFRTWYIHLFPYFHWGYLLWVTLESTSYFKNV